MCRILIAEDHIGIQKLIGKIIENQGCEVIFSSTAKETVDIATKFCPQAIFLDLDLPDRNGFDVLKALRLKLKTRHIPVVAMNDYRILTDRARCLRTGFAEYMTKPVMKGNLYDILESVRGVER